MLNFNFLEKGLGIVSPPRFCITFLENCFPYYVLLTDHNIFSDCHSFLRYWAKYVLQLFVSQVVTYKCSNQPLLSNQAIFLHDQKAKTKIYLPF